MKPLINEKYDDSLRTIVMLAIFWIWLPTGPSIAIVQPYIISKIGFPMYVLISIFLVIYMYKTIDGKTIGDKIRTVKKEVMGFLK